MPERIFQLYEEERFPEALAELERRAPELARLDSDTQATVLTVGCELAFRTRKPELVESWGKRVMQLRRDQPEAALKFCETVCRYFLTLQGPLAPALPFARFLLTHERSSGLAPLLAIALQSRSATLLREVLEMLLTNRKLRADERTLQLWAEVERVPGYTQVLSPVATVALEQARALVDAARDGQAGAIAAALGKGAHVNCQLPQPLSTPLMAASARGYLPVLEQLCSAGAELELRDSDGWTALHHAAREGHAEIIRTLAQRGAQLDSPGLYQQTALHLAADHGQVRAVQALLQAGASLEVLDARGYTPLTLAAPHPAVMQLLGAPEPEPEQTDSVTASWDRAVDVGEYRVGDQEIIVSRILYAPWIVLRAGPYQPCYSVREIADLRAMLQTAAELIPHYDPGNGGRVGELPYRGVRLRVVAGRRENGAGVLGLSFEPSDFASRASGDLRFFIEPATLPALLELLEMAGKLASSQLMPEFELRKGRLTATDPLEVDGEPFVLTLGGHVIGPLGEDLDVAELQSGDRVRVWPGYRVEVREPEPTRKPYPLDPALEELYAQGQQADDWLHQGHLARAREAYEELLQTMVRGGKIDSTAAAKCALGVLLAELRSNHFERANKIWVEKDSELLQLGVKCLEMGQTSRHDELIYYLICAQFNAANPDVPQAERQVTEHLELVLKYTEDRHFRRLALSNWHCHLREMYQEKVSQLRLEAWRRRCRDFGLTVKPAEQVTFPRPYPWVIDWGDTGDTHLQLTPEKAEAPPASAQSKLRGWMAGLDRLFRRK